MNLLRFKAPALIELVTPAAQPGIFTIPLTRDIRVVNAFAFGGSPSTDESGFQLFAASSNGRQNISKVVPLAFNRTTYLEDIDVEWLTLRAGWTLGVEVFTPVQANIYIWSIPLPKVA